MGKAAAGKSSICVSLPSEMLDHARGVVRAQIMSGDMAASMRRLVEGAVRREIARLERRGYVGEPMPPGNLPVGGRRTRKKRKKD